MANNYSYNDNNNNNNSSNNNMSWTNSSLFQDYYEYPDLDAVDEAGQAVLISLYSVTAVLALVGNMTVILVLVLGKRSARGLRVFLVNLAATDVTMAVFSIPFTYTTFMLGHWVFSPAFCPIVQFMQHVSVTGSVYTLTVIGLDRYYAIMYPLHPRWTKTGGAVAVLGIWLLACGVSTPQLVVSRAVMFTWQGRVLYECREEWSSDDHVREVVNCVYTVVIFLVTFVLPLLALAFTYASIAIVLWRRSSPGNANTTRDRQQLQDKIKVVKMLALVVIMFAVCWLPLHIFNLLVHLWPNFAKNFSKSNVFSFMFFGCHWLSVANSFFNPIIYCFMSDNFWGDLRTLLLRCAWVFSGSPRGRCPSSFRSTSYALSFRKTSGNSHIRRMGDGCNLDRPPTGDDASSRLNSSTNGRRNCSVDDCACGIATELSEQITVT